MDSGHNDMGSYQCRSMVEEIASLRQKFEAEKAIVDRIWDMFGRPSYEELKGRSIYDLIDELREQRAETAEAENAVLREKLVQALAIAKKYEPDEKTSYVKYTSDEIAELLKEKRK